MTTRTTFRGSKLLRRVESSLWVAGILLTSCCVGAWLAGRVYQAYQSRQLDRALGTDPAPVGAKASRIERAPYSNGGLVGRLEIPRVGLSVVVLDGDDESTLLLGAGLVPGTSRAGNLVIGGHRDTFFRPLREVRKGDRIRVTTLDGAYPYVVEWTAVVDPSDTDVLADTPQPSLTLVTCYPFQFVGPAPQRFVVRARLTAGDGTSPVPEGPEPDARPSPFLARQRPAGAALLPVAGVGRAEGSNAGADAAAAETPAEPPIDQPSAALSGHGIRRLNPGRLIKKLARAVHRPKTEARAGERSNGVF